MTAVAADPDVSSDFLVAGNCQCGRLAFVLDGRGHRP